MINTGAKQKILYFTYDKFLKEQHSKMS